MAENTKPVVTDPGNSMKVRFTDNSAKEGDFYPEDQVKKPLFLGPSGTPYSEWKELDEYEIGQNERTDAEAVKDNVSFEMGMKLAEHLDKDGENANS